MIYKHNNQSLIEKIDNYSNMINKYSSKPFNYGGVNYSKNFGGRPSSIENSKNNLNISANYHNNSRLIKKMFNKKSNFGEYKKLSKYPSLPNFKVHKNNSVDFIYENEKYKIIINKIQEHEMKKTKKILKLPNFNYSCCLDKNNIFCLKYTKPKENIKKRTIRIIHQINNIKTKNDHKIPRMVKILAKNNQIYDEVFSQPWKYPELFQH